MSRKERHDNNHPQSTTERHPRCAQHGTRCPRSACRPVQDNSLPYSARTADARIRYNTLLQLAAVLCVSTAFLQNTTVISTPDPVTLIFRLCYLDKERKALAKFFPGHPGLQKHDRIFSSLHTEYLQTKKCLLP